MDLLLLVASLASAAAAAVPQSPLALTIVTPDVPSGGVAQVRIALVQPRQIASGRIMMDFDPAVFGPVTAFDVFSATGDQIGVANLRDRHLDAQFSSPSGSIGRLPGIPAITVTVPVLAGAKPGAVASIAISADGAWKDVQGYQYVLGTQTVQFRVGGNLSIDSVTPGGGMLPAGTTVRIAGRGFTAATTVDVEGVVVGSRAFVNSEQINLTLGAPADLTGKRVVARNADGVQVDFYSALRGKFHTPTPGTTVQPIFPLLTYPAAGSWPAAQNPNTEPVDLTYYTISTRGVSQLPQYQIVRLEPGEIATIPPNIVGIGSQIFWALYSSKPVRMVQLLTTYPGAGAGGTSPGIVAALAYAILPQMYLSWTGAKPSCSVDPFLGVTSDPPCVVWLIGSAPPNPLPMTVSTSAQATTFTVSVSTADGGQWLRASPTRGTTCLNSYSGNNCSSAMITVDLDPAVLAPGEYTGTITITPESDLYSPQTVTVLFRITTTLISVQGPGFLNFVTNADGTAPDPIQLQVTSSGDSVPFSAAVRNPQTAFAWLSVTPGEAVTPAPVTVTANPSVFPDDIPGALNYITIKGPANSVSRQVTLLRRDRVPALKLYTSPPGALTFWTKEGATTPAARLLAVFPYVPDTVTVATDEGGNWLKASIDNGLSIAADPSGLSAGTYHGTITAANGAHSDYAPTEVSVTLVVWSDPPTLSVSPTSIVVSVRSGDVSSSYPGDEGALPLLNMSSGGTPVDSSVTLSTQDGGDWLAVPPPLIPVPYGSVFLLADARNLPPGAYHATVKINAPLGSPNSVSVPVTLNVTPAMPARLPDAPPLAVSLVNAASQTVGAIAADEAVSIYGLNVGPDGRALFEDLPATILSSSPTRVDAVVPPGVVGRASAIIRVDVNGTQATLGGVPVVAAAPAIFTTDGSGVGQASAFNEDSSPNSDANPAARGSLIRIRATGAGTTLPIGVKVQGIDATVESSIEEDGVMELQVRVPGGAQPGTAVSIVLTAGPKRSSDGVTISVK